MMRASFSRFALVALGGLLTMSCRSSTEPVVSDATFLARWQGQEWQGKASATLLRAPSADTLYLFGNRPVTNSLGSYEEVVRVRVAFHGVGQYPLDSAAVELLEIIGGDGISGSFTGTSSSVGVLDVTAYGGPSGDIQGTVQFDARRARSASSPIIRFENGRFRATVVAASLSDRVVP
ncbi:MAG: hypothetical protein JWL61_1539 [Gemmatimonadetes bacterium]|nr:hypothetical protein [Gemmatimonadota bacterium]